MNILIAFILLPIACTIFMLWAFLAAIYTIVILQKVKRVIDRGFQGKGIS